MYSNFQGVLSEGDYCPKYTPLWNRLTTMSFFLTDEIL